MLTILRVYLRSVMAKLTRRPPDRLLKDPVLFAIHALTHQIHDLDHKLDRVLAQGVQIMKANEQVLAFLAELKTYTDKLAAEQTVQTAKLTEVQSDIDELLAKADPELSPEVKTALAEASATIGGVVAFEQAQSATLTAIAAKNDQPLPTPVPPVEPPPA